MFTGIVEETGKILNIKRKGNAVELTVGCKEIMDDIRQGDSISVNGICLTVSEYGNSWFSADVMPETIRKTGLVKLNVNDGVNLERAVRLSDRLGGHMVSGHIDGTGSVAKVSREENAIWITVKTDEHLLKYIVEKGSVAIDGVSLTVAFIDEESFSFSLIPHTAGVTILGTKKPGDMVNIECDIIGKYIEKLFYVENDNKSKEKLTRDFLQNKGFV